MIEKTHWLRNPNKNYLGHWDIPGGEDVVLTIKSAAWEEVKNPLVNSCESKRVVRFAENFKWLKPFICNETNAAMILKATGKKYMEDCGGSKLQIGVSQTKVKRDLVDCLRVRDVSSSVFDEKNINDEQFNTIISMLTPARKTEKEICAAMRLASLKELKVSKFEGLFARLKELANENN